ncbi:tetratricopeptide repeat protein [Sphingobium sp. AR-3-1]|uniref:Tetratricopeptide repeat protein n=1 Tax=Sphingobium psychrophilum TaxID=2728834 RepID=A0A7X9ZSR9_9SPHN|nr:SPOR domain-containing protein [Sphingobium psychrophilum]NML10852.1 tetratricopeptide repeat protein [Sphingobium psychrophilum]
MKHIWGTAALVAMLGVALPALADVKTGVDAWQQGDYAKAIAEWRPLAQSGDPDAQFNLAQAYKLGRGVQPDLNTAIDWYRKAAVQGHLRAEDNLGLLLFQHGDRTDAMPYLQRASMRGEPRAQYIVGTALFNGDTLAKDWVRAYALMTRASASGLPQASTSLEQMDKYIPEDQRKQGLALAASLEKGDKSVTLAQAAPPPPRSNPSAVRTTQLPPSTPSQPTPAPAPPRPAPQQVAVAKPKPAPAPTRPAATAPAPAASGGWRVQLGAFGEEGRARALWSQLSRKVSGLSAYQPYLVKAGAVTRLQAGPLASSIDAARLCGAIKAAGADCMPKKM